MKIAVNTRLLRKERMTGIELFTFETMSRIAAAHPEHTFYYLFDRQWDESFITSENIIPVVLPFKSHYRSILLKFWFEFVLPRALKKIQPDLFVSPDSMNCLSSPFPSVTVVHDIGFEHYPKHLPSGISKFLRKNTPLYVKKAHRVATVSEFSKHDIAQHYNIPLRKIDVVYNGANPGYKVLNEKEKEIVRLEISQSCPYFLFIGTIHPRKNLVAQLKAYHQFRTEHPESKHKFVVVGDKWIVEQEMDAVIAGLPNPEDVIFVGRVSSDNLGRIISAASALMYVSLFEGFGIPILEAFYAGTPVITANVSSMPEVAGNAALCVDPLNPQDIANAMQRIVYEHGLAQKLIESGNERKNDFYWDKTAGLLWECMEKVLTEKP